MSHQFNMHHDVLQNILNPTTFPKTVNIFYIVFILEFLFDFTSPSNMYFNRINVLDMKYLC